MYWVQRTSYQHLYSFLGEIGLWRSRAALTEGCLAGEVQEMHTQQLQNAERGKVIVS